MRTGQMCQHIAFKTIEHHRPQVCMSVGFVLTSDPTLTGVAHNGLRYSLMSAWCQKRTLLASWNVSLPRAGQRLYAANPASNDLLHIGIFKFEV